ncbi:hypothetical protein GC175_07275 [bacterium]|nr:hypothetical protein [bacterium]
MLNTRRVSNTRSTWSALWITWIMANALGGLVVGMLEGGGLQFAATLVLSGPILGAVQWLVLKRALRIGPIWILGSTVGWLAGTAAGMAASPLVDQLVAALMNSFGQWEVLWLNAIKQTLILTILGLAHWAMLRQRIPDAGWWIGASALAGLAQGTAQASFCAAACEPVMASMGNMVATGLTYSIGWVAYSIVTGYALVRSLQTKLR